MHIEIDNNFAIGSDKHQFILKKKDKRKNPKTGEMEIYWRSDSYFSTLSGLANHLILAHTRDSAATTLAELALSHENAVGAIRLALCPEYKVEKAA